MWKIKFIGGPKAGEVEERTWVGRRLEFISMSQKVRGTYVLVDKDEETKSAAMRFEQSEWRAGVRDAQL